MTADSNQFIRIIKQVALASVEASKPCDISYGIVESESPIQIKLANNDEIILGEKQLILTEAVTDHTVSVVLDHTTEEALLHSHQIEGTKTIIIKYGLRKGDEVVMVRESGGQRFVVVGIKKRAV